MSAGDGGQQVVGIDLHRRRSVMVRMAENGERLRSVRIANDAMTPPSMTKSRTPRARAAVAKFTEDSGRLLSMAVYFFHYPV
jgi:hypothetical protein